MRLKDLFSKYKEILLYLIFGVLTTVVNIVVYYLFSDILKVQYLVSNCVAWFLSVLFAYITNRKYVFESTDDSMLVECAKFFGARLSTGIIDMILMAILVPIFIKFNLIIKILVNVLVVVLNYIFSKLFVFKKG